MSASLVIDRCRAVRCAWLLSALSACAETSTVSIGFPIDQETGTEILVIEQEGRWRAFVYSLANSQVLIPIELHRSGVVSLEALLFTQAPAELGLTEGQELTMSPEGREGRSASQTFALSIREGIPGEWTMTTKPTDGAARFLPAPAATPCSTFLSDVAFVRPEDFGGGAFIIDPTTAMVIIYSEDNIPRFFSARVMMTPEEILLEHPTFRVVTGVQSKNTIWLAGFEANQNRLGTVSLEAGIQVISGVTPNIVDMTPADENDSFAFYAIDTRGAIYGYVVGTNTWNNLGQTKPERTGRNGRLTRIGDAELLAIDPAGCELHRVPGDRTRENTDLGRDCGTAAEIFTAIEHLAGIGSFAGTSNETLLRRDPIPPVWETLPVIPLVLSPDHAFYDFEPYPGGFLIGGSRGAVQQYLLDDRLTCHEQTLTIIRDAHIRQIVKLADGWIVTGQIIDPNDPNIRDSFISSFREVSR